MAVDAGMFAGAEAPEPVVPGEAVEPPGLLEVPDVVLAGEDGAGPETPGEDGAGPGAAGGTGSDEDGAVTVELRTVEPGLVAEVDGPVPEVAVPEVTVPEVAVSEVAEAVPLPGLQSEPAIEGEAEGAAAFEGSYLSESGQIDYGREDPDSAEFVGTVSSGEGSGLPHWADPPTGEVPAALAGQHGQDDEMQAWRLLGSRGLHWRDDVNDWADGPGVEDLVDENDQPVTPPPNSRGGPFSFDEDFERLDRERFERSEREKDQAAWSQGDAIASDVTIVGDADDLGEAGFVATEMGEVARRDEVALGGQVFSGSGNGPDVVAPGEDVLVATGATAGGGASPGVAQVPNDRARVPGSGRGGGSQGKPWRNVPGRGRAAPARSGPRVSGTTDRRESLQPGGPMSNHGAGRPYDMAADSAEVARGRDVAAAVTTGIGLIVVFTGCYLIGPAALVGLSAAAIFGCALEAFAMLQRVGFRPATLVGALGSGGAVLAAYWRGTGALPVMLVVVVAASLVWYLLRVVDARPVVNVAVTVLGFAWVGVFGSFAGVLLQEPYGKHLFLGAVVPTVVCDLAAWFAGSLFGSHPLAPQTSPGKTWEGFLLGGVAAVIAGAVVGKEITPWAGAVHGIELGLVIAIVAPIGDLVQSMVKRDLHLKDSGAVLPGHGGLLDRFDSLLFVLPATYFLVAVLHIA